MTEPDTEPVTQVIPNAQAAQLEYGQRPSLPWLSRHRRLLISVALLMAAAASIYRYGPDLRRRVLWVYWSHRAAAHQMPAVPSDVVVGDPTTARKLLREDPDYVSASTVGWSPSTSALYIPKSLRQLEQLDPRVAVLMAHEVAFWGLLRRPDGTPRLVALTLIGQANGYALMNWTKTAVVPTVGLFSPLPKSAQGWGLAYSGASVEVRFKTGRLDPQDPSHVSIPISIKDTRDRFVEAQLEMYLQNDDSLLFKLLDTPDIQRLRVRLEHDAQHVNGFQTFVVPARGSRGR